MPPALPRRSLSSSFPTVLSLSKLFHLIPSLTSLTSSSSRQHVKRGAEWAVQTAAKAPIEPEDPPDSPVFWWKLGLSVCLVLAGGVFAGLTLALMGSDDLNLRVLSTSSEDPKERKAASKVLRLLGRGRHWVLVVLLLGNVIVNESLPIFLDDVLGGGVAAVIVSTTMIVIFGEIIPQAVCVRYGLTIGGACAPLVLGLMIFFAPIAWPIAKLLDYVLGREEGHTYKKAELKSFLQFHKEGEEPLRDDEIGILNGVLSLNDKKANEIMTPIKDCLTLSSDKILDHESIDQILLSGFSRIPIHEPGQKDNFIGMLLVKRLITYNPEDEFPVSRFPLLPLPEARPDINCFQALDYFQTGRAHLLLISETPGRKGGALGIVSLEDLIEEIIGEEIVDETDRFQDNKSHKVAKRAGTAAVMRGIIERQRVIGALSRRPSRGDTNSHTPVQMNASGSSDGLLIQLHDGSIVAEPVTIPDGFESALPSDGRKLVVGGDDRMDSIAEASSHGGDSPVIVPHGENGVKVEGVEAEVAGDIVIAEEAAVNGNGEGSKNTNGNTDLLGDLPEVQSGSIPFTIFEEFEIASKAFLDKYGGKEGKEDDVGPERTNCGWEWQEQKSKWVKGEGYLHRRNTRYVRPSSAPTTDAAAEVKAGEGEEEGLEDHEETSLLADAPKAKVSRSREETDKDEEDGKKERIEVEFSIVYSKTYHVPQLLFRAWDSDGAPLSLLSLLRHHIVRAGAHPHSEDKITDTSDSIMLDPHSPFPLLQQLEHPYTKEVVWSVHPCQVSVAVEEVLRAEAGEQAADAKPPGSEAVVQGGQKGLKWLETWMMLSNGVVDLTA